MQFLFVPQGKLFDFSARGKYIADANTPLDIEADSYLDICRYRRARAEGAAAVCCTPKNDKPSGATAWRIHKVRRGGGGRRRTALNGKTDK